MLCIKQAAPCSDSSECSSSASLNIWQGSDPAWLPSDLIQHSPVQLTIAGLRILTSRWTRRTSTASNQLPPLSLKILTLIWRDHKQDYAGSILLIPLPIFQALISSNQGGDTKLPRGNGLETAEILNIWNCIIQCATDIRSYGLSVDLYQLNPVVRMGRENKCPLCCTGWVSQSRMSYGNV